MDKQNRLIRELLLYEYQLGHNAAEAARNICQAKGEHAVSHVTAKRWFKKFKTGIGDLDDHPHTGRPTTVDPELLKQAVEARPSTSSRGLAGQLGISQTSVVRHLHTLGKTNRRCRVVPHELTPAQALRRVEICRQLLENPTDYRFFRRIVTSDEKWVYFRNPDTRNQWLDPGQAPEPVPKRGRYEHKVMLCVWWNCDGVIHHEFVPNGRGITAALYSGQLERMYAILRQKYPALVNRKRILYQQDNAPPHVARSTRVKLQELDGIELMPHPAYSPDLAPSDYHLFRALAHFLKGRHFHTQADVESGVQEFFASKTKDWYYAGIRELAQRWVKTIDHDGLYFDE